LPPRRPAERTLTGLSLLLQSNALKSRLLPYTLEGPFGALLDAAEDRLEIADVQCFETEALMGQPAPSCPVLTYLFHRLRSGSTAADPARARRGLGLPRQPAVRPHDREWLTVLRKKNVAVASPPIAG
jgi:type IV secretion system protein VirB4